MQNNPSAPLGQTTGTPPPLPGTQNEYGYRTTAGMGTINSRYGLGSVATTGLSGIVMLNFFRACKNMPANRWDMAVAVAAGATPTLIRGGLYTVDATYNLTQVAASPNDTTLLSTANVKAGKAFSTPWNMNYGQWYAYGFIWISAATAPSLLGMPSAGGVTHFAQDSDPRTVQVMIGAQTDLPAAITPAQLNATNICLWSELS